MTSDARVRQDVLAELAWETSIDAPRIAVKVEFGVVTLAGRVDSYAEKWHAASAARRVSGARSVAIEMDVQLPGLSRRNDAEISRSANNALRLMALWPEGSVTVMVESGWITLSGKVRSEDLRQAAARAVRYLVGVQGVNEDIAINPEASVGAAVLEGIPASARGA